MNHTGQGNSIEYYIRPERNSIKNYFGQYSLPKNAWGKRRGCHGTAGGGGAAVGEAEAARGRAEGAEAARPLSYGAQQTGADR